MADTFSNDLRLRLQESGSNAGTWGDLLNGTITNIASALGQGSEAIPNASTHTITLADGTADEARSLYLKCTGGGQACTVTLGPNTISKVWIIDNATSYTLTFSQGSGANVSIAAGAVKVIATDGAGSGAAVVDTLDGLEGSLSTLSVSGEITANGGIALGDNDKAKFGASDDLQIYHDGNHSYIEDAGTGSIKIKVGDFRVENASGNNLIKGVGDVATLLHAGSEKLATTSTGIDVTGAVTSSGPLQLTAGALAAAGNAGLSHRSADNKVYLQAGTGGFNVLDDQQNTHLAIDSGGHASFTVGTNAMGTFGDSISEVGSGNFALQVTNSAGSALKPLGFRAEDIRFATGSTEVFRLTSAQDMYFGQTSGSAASVGHIMQANGALYNTANGTTVQYLRRLNSDGDIIQFNRDGTTVGAIGTINSSLYIASPYGNDSGLRFSDRIIHPCTTSGAPRDDAIDLGYSAGRFDTIFAKTGSINTSDRNEKQNIEALSDAEQRVAVAAKGLLRKYRWKSAVAEKGDDARIHFGIIAQDLQAAFEAEGLDAARYGMWCSDTWTDEDTGEERTRLGVRYSELLAFIISAI